MRYCLIGEKLGHSFSKEVHTLSGLDYSLVELKEEELGAFVKSREFEGFNVTIPYKTEIIKYLDVVDESAKEIGAVNTVVNKGGKLWGYNTDIFGMEKMAERIGVSLSDKVVMILGSGGTSKTATALALNQGAKKIYLVSRSGEVNYQNCYNKVDTEVIINTTPVGMYPNNFDRVIDLAKFPSLIGVLDCIYNPLKTPLILQAESLNIPASGGLYMLVGQAFGSQKLWLKKEISLSLVDEAYETIYKGKRNIVLSGMPACGKSTIGKLVSKKLGLEFVDTDVLIEERAGKKIKDIFAEDGEGSFRDLETKIIKEVSKKSASVISIGGGAPLREENRNALKQNGVIVYLKRDLKLLVDDDRPLSQKEGVSALYEKRKAIYEEFADVVVINDGEIEEAAEEIIKL